MDRSVWMMLGAIAAMLIILWTLIPYVPVP
jgi:hypothetical protein